MESKEKGMFHDWSVRNIGNYMYHSANKNTKSYFVQHNSNKSIVEYGFETIMDFDTELRCMWERDVYMEEIVKTVAVSTMKNYKRKVVRTEKEVVLDEFIYTF